LFTLFNVPGKDEGFNFLFPVVTELYYSKQVPLCQKLLKQTLMPMLFKVNERTALLIGFY